MRVLQTQDLFTFTKMIKKMEIKDELKSFFNLSIKKESPVEDENNNSSINVAIDLIMLILEKLDCAEKEFYNFVSPIAEKTEDELKVLPLDELITVLNEIYNAPKFPSFFNFAAK